MKIKSKKITTQTMVLGAMLTALVIVFQLIGSVIRFGNFSVSLVLVPIVIGAALCGPGIGAWLGFVFGIMVLITDAGAFLALNIPGTLITVLAKGALCGYVAGLVYNLFKKLNKFSATVFASLICPVVNSGVFALGCITFFFNEMLQAGQAEGYSGALPYIFLGMIGTNFIFELCLNIIFSPVMAMLINLYEKKKI